MDKIDFKQVSEKIEEVMVKFPQYKETLNTFEFDIFKFSAAVGRNM